MRTKGRGNLYDVISPSWEEHKGAMTTKKLSVQLFKVWLCPNGRKPFSITYFFLYRASASNLSTFWEWHIFCLQHYFYFLHFQVLLVPLLLLILGVTSASSASQTFTACFPSLYPSLKVLSHCHWKTSPFQLCYLQLTSSLYGSPTVSKP